VPIPGAVTPVNSLTSPSTGIGTTVGVFGVAIGIDPTRLSYDLVEKAKKLATALNEEGVAAFVDNVTVPAPASSGRDNSIIIHVRIGNKP
jgi:hypothetical protein